MMIGVWCNDGNNALVVTEALGLAELCVHNMVWGQWTNGVVAGAPLLRNPGRQSQHQSPRPMK